MESALLDENCGVREWGAALHIELCAIEKESGARLVEAIAGEVLLEEMWRAELEKVEVPYTTKDMEAPSALHKK